MKLHYTVRAALECDTVFAEQIAFAYKNVAGDNDTGNGMSTDFINERINEGSGIIAITEQNKWLGFCYIDLSEDGFVRTYSLVVSGKFRQGNVIKQLLEKSRHQALIRYPDRVYAGFTNTLLRTPDRC